MHRDPSVRHQQIRAAHRFFNVPLDLDLHTFGPRLLNKFRLGIQRRWAGKNEIKAKLPGRMDEARTNVVAITRPDHALAPNRAAMLFKRQDIGHDLAWMAAVGQPIDHRNTGIIGHFQQGCLLKSADHDHVHIAAQNPRRIRDGFPMAQLHFAAGQNHGLPTHLPHAKIKAHAGARGWLFENQRHHLALKWAFSIQHAFGQAGTRRLDPRGLIQNATQILGINLINIEKILHL